MLIRGINFTDIVNYKKISTFIIMPNCSFKCDKECNSNVCQNSQLANEEIIDYSVEQLINEYDKNSIAKAIVFGGLEPLDSFNELYDFITKFRLHHVDDIVIYTGYYKDEVADKIEKLKKFNNIIIKFGRFIPNQEKHYDEVLGVYLASLNQVAEKIS